MKLVKILSLLTLLLLPLVACDLSKSTDIQKTNTKLPYAVVLGAGQKDNIIAIDENLEVIRSYSLGTYITDIQISGTNLYAVDPGLEISNKDFYQVDLTNDSKSKIQLPYRPHLFAIAQNKAFISSSEEKKGQGFYLMTVDLKSLKVLDTLMIPGAITNIVNEDNTIYVSFNTGGANNYGKNTNIIQIDPKTNAFKKVLTQEQELSPASIVKVSDKLYGVYPGFARGPKPKWLQQPSEYTNKLKIIDLKSGKIEQQFDLPFDFPQSIAINSKVAFINHYTNLDMSGDTVTVFDLKTNKVSGKINTPTPSAIAADDKYLLVANHNEDELNIFDSNSLTKLKQIKVGKWPSKVILVRNQ